ncbi:MAG: DNA cytosine methyltransferase [Rhizobiaceae bacterium]
MTAYYNEHDPKAAAWLRELIERGHIAPGVVDERSIEDVTPDDLAGFVQCHFFAGIGVWSYALRRAGWPDDRPIWTGSCPCQPFSAAGKGGGTADERHLWPAWFWLIDQCRPDVVFGEQVSSKDGLGWLDLVSADLEGAGYAIGALDSCAAGVGAPHIRQRLYFGAERLADADDAGLERRREPGRQRADQRAAGADGMARGMADAAGERRERRRPSETRDEQCQIKRPDGFRDARGMADADGGVAGDRRLQSGGKHGQQPENAVAGDTDRRPGPTNGFWRASDWLRCRDDRWRPVEPGTFPLAHGTAARVGRLRGYGNGLVAPHAATFIAAFEEARSQGGA